MRSNTERAIYLVLLGQFEEAASLGSPAAQKPLLAAFDNLCSENHLPRKRGFSFFNSDYEQAVLIANALGKLGSFEKLDSLLLDDPRSRAVHDVFQSLGRFPCKVLAREHCKTERCEELGKYSSAITNAGSDGINALIECLVSNVLVVPAALLPLRAHPESPVN